MTREQIIAWAKQQYGQHWVSRLAKDINYSVSLMSKFSTGERTKVSRRMELEMKALIRREQIRCMTEHAADARYE